MCVESALFIQKLFVHLNKNENWSDLVHFD